MSSTEVQETLADKQESLVRALTGQGPPPAGFDGERIAATATSLIRKRMRTVARVWPALAEVLGREFPEKFAAYARSTPLPLEGGPLADGHVFARYLSHRGAFPDAARRELIAIGLHFRCTRDGLVRRRWPVVKTAILRNPFRLVIAFGCRWGEWWWTVPMGR